MDPKALAILDKIYKPDLWPIETVKNDRQMVREQYRVGNKNLLREVWC
jgi:hypothetical protein